MGPGMQIQARLIQQDDRVLSLAAIGVCRERDVESEEPLEPTTSLVEVDLHVIGTCGVRDDRVEVVRVEVEANLERAVFPEALDLASHNGARSVRKLVSRFVVTLSKQVLKLVRL